MGWQSEKGIGGSVRSQLGVGESGGQGINLRVTVRPTEEEKEAFLVEWIHWELGSVQVALQTLFCVQNQWVYSVNILCICRVLGPLCGLAGNGGRKRQQQSPIFKRPWV